jgi:hypothetical protein
VENLRIEEGYLLEDLLDNTDHRVYCIRKVVGRYNSRFVIASERLHWQDSDYASCGIHTLHPGPGGEAHWMVPLKGVSEQVVPAKSIPVDLSRAPDC